MPIQDSGSGPYAPIAAVVSALDAYRDSGLAVNATNLPRLGVADSIVPRTLSTFRMLDLLDEQGQPTQDLLDFKQAPSDSYKERLAATLRSAYAPVFAVVGPDPSQVNPDRMTDAFRQYTPDSLRPRMIRLFLGLCEYTGIIDEVPVRKSGPKGPRSPRRPAAASRKAESNGSSDTAPTPPPAAGQSVRKFQFPSGRSLTVTVNDDVLMLDRTDRNFVIGIIDQIEEYVESGTPVGAPSVPASTEGGGPT